MQSHDLLGRIQGEFMGMAPTNKKFEITACDQREVQGRQGR